MSEEYDYTRYYLKVNNESTEGIKKIIAYNKHLINDYLPDNKDIKILDVGCGRGYMLMALAEMGYKNIFGVDISEGQIEGCIEHGVPAVVVEDSSKYLLENQNEYDVIILFDVLEHIPKEDTIGFLKSVHASLKDAGILCCKVPNANSIIAPRWRYIDWTHCVSFTEHSLDFVLYNSGFENNIIVEEKDYTPISRKEPIKSTVFFILKKIYRCFVKFAYNMELGAEGRKIPLSLNILSISKK